MGCVVIGCESDRYLIRRLQLCICEGYELQRLVMMLGRLALLVSIKPSSM